MSTTQEFKDDGSLLDKDFALSPTYSVRLTSHKKEESSLEKLKSVIYEANLNSQNNSSYTDKTERTSRPSLLDSIFHRSTIKAPQEKAPGFS